MPQRVRTPDGGTAVFPDGMSDAQITAVLRREFPPENPQTTGTPGVTARPAPDAAGQTGRAVVRGFQRGAKPGLDELAADAAPLPKTFGELPAFLARKVNIPMQAMHAANVVFGGAAGAVSEALQPLAQGHYADPNDPNVQRTNAAHPFPMDPQHATTDRDVTDMAGTVATSILPLGGPTRLAAAAAEEARAAQMASRAARPPRSITALQQRVEKFDRAGVTPTMAAVGPEGSAQVAKFAAENPLVGGAAKRNLRRSVAETGQAADALAHEYGAPASRPHVGGDVQAGIDTFANQRSNTPGAASLPTRATSFSTKAGALYDAAFARIPNGVVRPVKTQGVVRDVLGNVDAPALRTMLEDPTVKGISEALTQDAGKVTFGDLRALRTYVRTARRNPELRASIGDANLSRMESALTEDIYAAAETLSGGHRFAAQQLRRADQYYAAGSERINSTLGSIFKAPNGEGAYDRLIGAASDGGKADIQRLLSAKRSLPPEMWGDVAATALKRLGKPTAATEEVAAEDAFSINTFVTNYNKLSPEGREVLFGSRGGGGAQATRLRAQLDNLAEVADMQKAVERAANTSNTAVAGQSIATVAGLVTNTGPTIAALGAVRGLGEVMTNPRFVRWVVRMQKAPTPQAQAAVLDQLDALEKGDPAVAAVAPQIREAIKGAQVTASAVRHPQHNGQDQ